MSDKDFAEFGRQYSPDSSMMLLNYGIDLGAFDYSHVGTAVLKLSDTTNNLHLLTLPAKLERCEWIDNKTASTKFDIIPWIRKAEQPKIKDTTVNGILIRILPYDYIEPNAVLVIEHRETSPNGKYELVAYRYMNDKNNANFIHVSIIPINDHLPKYGNYLIADMQSDYVLNGKWDKDNSIIFYSNSLYADMIQYYFVKNRPDATCKVVVDDKTYINKYLWTKLFSQ